MKNQIITAAQDVLVKCDNPLCDYEVSNDTKDPNNPDLKEYLNRPCPKCGENLLTEKDYKEFLKMMKLVRIINKMSRFLRIKPKSDDKQVLVSVNCHDGKYTVKVQEDE